MKGTVVVAAASGSGGSAGSSTPGSGSSSSNSTSTPSATSTSTGGLPHTGFELAPVILLAALMTGTGSLMRWRLDRRHW
jgi:uncharacterized membrane protein